MREVTTKVYSNDDMLKLKEMSYAEAEDILQYAYGGYINRYAFPEDDSKWEEYDEDQYDSYRVYCAFRKAYEALERVIENDKNYDD